MEFIADLHVHSKFSRATAKNLDIENLYIAAQLKGITVVGTGDFTHPEWFSEIREKLIPAEPGLFRLDPDIEKHCDEKVPVICRAPVRFILVSEISNIYKKKDKTRKNHNLIFLPGIEQAERFNDRLDKIGNIKSDGRPILGLDARSLLEIMLEVSEHGFLIPAHIWTPWFSVLGSKSGFDSVSECFEDLTQHIFAVETGLSSDPPMNWRVSTLDRFTLVSNSDAHSPLKLGREANIFKTELSYKGIRNALETGDTDQFRGTYEFYPEEGKYHADGHRKCNVRLDPRDTIQHEGLCPVCGKPLTLGVLHRVEALADRDKGDKPGKTHPYYGHIPLDDLLSELFKVGAGSKKVKNNWMKLIETFGPEFHILHKMETDKLKRTGVPLLGEAIEMMRNKEVTFSAGFDGEFGKLHLFTEQEKERLLGQKSLFGKAGSEQIAPDLGIKSATIPLPEKKPQTVNIETKGKVKTVNQTEKTIHLNVEQEAAVLHEGGPLIIVAGPGTGKTRTITHRIVHLIKENKIPLSNILAVTFTNQAAREMKERLSSLLDRENVLPYVATFHSLCLDILTQSDSKLHINVVSDSDRRQILKDSIVYVKSSQRTIPADIEVIEKNIIEAKQRILSPDEIDIMDTELGMDKYIFSAIYESYQKILDIQGMCDFEDLIFKVVKKIESDQGFCKKYRDKFTHIFVDEYQDLNHAQYRIIKALSPPDKDICVIGDPDQSIYGFRGSDLTYFQRFIDDFPESRIIALSRNYRSSESILESSYQVIHEHKIEMKGCENTRTYSRIKGEPVIHIMELPTDRAEAVAIGKVIEKSIGGTGFYALDFGKVDSTQTFHRGFSDFAVLYRTNAQGHLIAEVLEKAGIPYQVASRDNILQKKSIQELISFLRIVLEQGTFPDFQRINGYLKPSLGPKILDAFKNWAYAKSLPFKVAVEKAMRVPIPGMSMSGQQRLFSVLNQLSDFGKQTNHYNLREKLIFLTEKTGLFPRFNNDKKATCALETLLEIADKTEFSQHDFPSRLFLQADTDIYDPCVEKVSLMTMHAAKGLEFPVVFIAGCESNLIPYQHADSPPVDLAEERRIFYVAMTRAKQQLYLTSAKSRTIYGQKTVCEQSPFVADIEERLKAYESNSLNGRKKGNHKQLNLF